MRILNSRQIREVDRLTIEKIGIPGTTLMENAGIQVVQIMEENFKQLSSLRIAIVCGKGNNGGDGFVIARQLYMRGIVPHVYIVCDPEEIQGDARINLNILRNYGDIPLIEIPGPSSNHSLELDSYHVIVDAILGTGLTAPVEGFLAQVIETINQSPAEVVAVDMPSGLFADEYRPVDTAVYADLTVTFTAPKPGLLLGEAYSYTGNLYTVAIGSPEFLLNVPGHTLNLIEDDDVKGFFIPRKKTTHKGNYGHILVVGGCRGKTGAARLAGLAALRSGAGLVTLALPEAYLDQALADSPELMAEALRGPQGYLGQDAAGEVLSLLEKRDLLVLGPGLGVHPETVRFVQELLPELEVPAVIDADALNCLAGDLSVLKKVDCPLVLTPHPGEMARLLGCTTSEVQENREGVAQSFSREYGVYLILKGHRTIFAEPGGQVWINMTGNPGMATAGAGDVLSGVLGAFAARINHQNPEAWTMACTSAVYLHGLAGDLAAEAFTEETIIARDIINHFHAALQKIIET